MSIRNRLHNTYITRKADTLPPDRQKRIKVLRELYIPLASAIYMFCPAFINHRNADPLPNLPMRTGTVWPYGVWPRDYLRDGRVPDDVLDATALRPLMDTLMEHARRATAEFDEVFGERA
jgi:restriction system protein